VSVKGHRHRPPPGRWPKPYAAHAQSGCCAETRRYADNLDIGPRWWRPACTRQRWSGSVQSAQALHGVTPSARRARHRRRRMASVLYIAASRKKGSTGSRRRGLGLRPWCLGLGLVLLLGLALGSCSWSWVSLVARGSWRCDRSAPSHPALLGVPLLLMRMGWSVPRPSRAVRDEQPQERDAGLPRAHASGRPGRCACSGNYSEHQDRYRTRLLKPCASGSAFTARNECSERLGGAGNSLPLTGYRFRWTLSRAHPGLFGRIT
jgi:hypothetical protein